MPRSAVDLVRELGYRWASLALATPTDDSGTTSLIDTGFDDELPNTIPGFNAWVYGGLDVPAANVGIERRTNSWSQPAHTLTFNREWPTSIIAEGTYEVYRRSRRSRLVAALNAGIGELGHYWWRPFIDTSIRTVDGQYRYVLPTSQNWIVVNRMEIEGLSTSSFVGYPYEEIRGWGVEEDQTGGVRTLYLQFSTMPPAGRRLRIHGEGYFPSIEVDTDTLECAGPGEQSAVEWIWDYAEFKLDSWLLNAGATLDQQKTLALRQNKLADALEDVRKKLPHPKNVQIYTPLSRDGRMRRFYPDSRWIGAGWSQANH